MRARNGTRSSSDTAISEIFGKAFPDLKTRHRAILGKSVELHVDSGDSRLRRSEYGVAYREFRKALQLQPSDAVLQQKLSIAWNEHSNQVATERFTTRPTPRQSERDAVTQALDFASRYLAANKLDDAMKSVQVAEEVIPAYLPVLLKKAAVQTALGRYSEALRTLDEYDLHAVKDERAEANVLRNDVLFKRKNFVATMKADVAAALADRRPDKLLLVAKGGLLATDDPDLYY
jgi:tetratricopeptide (TPR) repeat protein